MYLRVNCDIVLTTMGYAPSLRVCVMAYCSHMGYSIHFSANQLGGPKKVCVIREYGLSELCVMRESTVVKYMLFSLMDDLMADKVADGWNSSEPMESSWLLMANNLNYTSRTCISCEQWACLLNLPSQLGWWDHEIRNSVLVFESLVQSSLLAPSPLDHNHNWCTSLPICKTMTDWSFMVFLQLQDWSWLVLVSTGLNQFSTSLDWSFYIK